jgi:hypothetical protein
MTDSKRPKVNNSQTQQELSKAAQQFDAFDAEVKEMTLDRMNEAPKANEEPQSKLSSKEIDRSKDIYLKPDRTTSDRQKFNEKFRKQYEFDKEYVQFIAFHKEILGETIEMWTHPYGGVGAEFWKVPTGKPVWGPRYLAEQIKRCKYHRLIMQSNTTTGVDGMGQYYGSMAADSTIQRLDAEPVSSRKSIFTGAANF